MTHTESLLLQADAPYQGEAAALARIQGYDIGLLQFHYARYQFGSLANNWEAPKMSRLYWDALQIARERARWLESETPDVGSQ